MPTKIHLQYRHKARELSRRATIAEPSPEARRAREDFGWFGEFVLGIKPMPHHGAWINALCTNQDSSQLKKVAGPSTAILAPRGSGKSSWFGAFCAWVLGHNPDCQIIYCSYSENVALSRSRLIQRIIQSDKYRQVFPEILPGKRFSATDWEIQKQFAGVDDLEADYSFLAVGMAGSITSKRSKLIVIDDILKSSEAAENPEVREKLETNWAEVVRPTLIPGGRVIAIGTRFRPDDMFATTFTEARGWRVIEQSAIVEDPLTGEEKSYWPERYPIEELQQLREDSPVSFSFQFLNKIVRISEISIDPNWIIKGEVPTKPEEFDCLVMGVDLSPTEKETSDYTCFVLGGRIGDRYYILDVWRGRSAGNIPKLEQMLSMAEDWGIIEMKDGKYESSGIPLYIYVEDCAYQSALAGDFRQIIQNKHRIYNLMYRPAKAKGTKLARLRGVTGLLENKLVTFNQFRSMGKLVEELVNFGSTPNDDCSDAFTYCMQGLSARAKLDVA